MMIHGMRLMEAEGMLYPVTPCCEALATGTTDGIACKACYEIVGDEYGAVWTPEELQAEQALMHRDGLVSMGGGA